MLISISGAQGSGKTTILEEIKRLGYNVVERKTSRSILSEWGTTLDNVYSDYDKMVQFQTELLARKKEDEEEAIASDKIWFTERSYADVFAYTLILLGWKNSNSDWIDEYYNKCCELNSKYSLIFYVKRFSLDKVNQDNVRGINKHYSNLVDNAISTTLQEMCWDRTNFNQNFQVKIIETPKIDDRVVTILRISHDTWLNKSFKSGCALYPQQEPVF